jgi:hypothetical protein
MQHFPPSSCVVYQHLQEQGGCLAASKRLEAGPHSARFDLSALLRLTPFESQCQASYSSRSVQGPRCGGSTAPASAVQCPHSCVSPPQCAAVSHPCNGNR